MKYIDIIVDQVHFPKEKFLIQNFMEKIKPMASGKNDLNMKSSTIISLTACTYERRIKSLIYEKSQRWVRILHAPPIRIFMKKA